MADTHTVMPKKLAQALMEAGMQHFDGGGLINLIPGLGMSNNFQAAGVDNTKNISQQYGQQQDVYGQQQALAQQLLQQSQGGGPANNLIAAQGGQNTANQAATMASVRGASANPAAIARQAAIQGQQGQQQVLNAQSQAELGSQNALAQQQGTMGNQALQGQQIGQNALASANAVNAGVAGQNAAANQGMFGGLVGGAAGALGSLFNQGGEVPAPQSFSQHLAFGGSASPFNFGGGAQPGMAQSPFGGMGQGLGGLLAKGIGAMFAGPQLPASGPGSQEDIQSGGLLTSGAQQQENQMSGLPLYPGAMASGGQVSFGQMLAGGNVPGKAAKPGDSKDNDTVPTMLSPGEVVIPRSITESKDAPQKAAEFIKHLKKKKGA